MASAFQILVVVIAALFAVFYSGKCPSMCKQLSTLIHGKAGCCPVADVGNVTIHYFQARGRAESFRLLMEEMSVPYTEINFNKETWPAHKVKGVADGLYTFGQVPAIETSSGVRLVQSQVILHYLGRATGLDCDCEHLHVCDTLAAGVEDALSRLIKILYSPDFNLAQRTEYITETMPLWLGHFEKLAPVLSKQDGAFFVGDRLTWVDFLIFDWLEVNLEFVRYDFQVGETYSEESIFSEFPRLRNFFRQFSSRPNIARYQKSKRRFSFQIQNTPKA